MVSPIIIPASGGAREVVTTLAIAGERLPAVLAYDDGGGFISASIAASGPVSDFAYWDELFSALTTSVLVHQPSSLQSCRYEVDAYEDPTSTFYGWLIYPSDCSIVRGNGPVNGVDVTWIVNVADTRVQSTVVILGDDRLPEEVYVRRFDSYGGQIHPPSEIAQMPI